MFEKFKARLKEKPKARKHPHNLPRTHDEMLSDHLERKRITETEARNHQLRFFM